jgi:hypothetical protein
MKLQDSCDANIQGRGRGAGWWLTISLLGTLLLCGCAESNVTNPPRSVTEQLLLSTAMDRALNTVPLTIFAGKKIFLDGSYFDSYDSKYMLGAIRDALSRNGAILGSNATNCDIIVEARSGALSTDSSQTLLGIPNTGVPIPLAGTLQIQELALYKASRQNSIAKIGLLAYSRNSGEHIFSSGPMVGRAFNTYYKLLFMIQWTSTDLPEKKWYFIIRPAESAANASASGRTLKSCKAGTTENCPAF